MIIKIAMDMLYTSELEGFCLVSSDSDFTKLASRLRESGKTVIGMGKDEAPFRKACDIFTVLELLLEHHRKGRGKKIQYMPPEKTVRAVGCGIQESDRRGGRRVITENQNNDKETGLGEVGNRIWLKLLSRF